MSRRRQQVPAGFRPSPGSNHRPISKMTIRELNSLHGLNERILASPDASTSTYVQRVLAEQAEIESRLIELEGVESIRTKLRSTQIRGDNDMSIDVPSEPPSSRTIEAKRKALALYAPNGNNDGRSKNSLSLQEAMDLERQAYLHDQERQQRILEKRRRLGMPIKGENLTRQEKEARLWAFLTHKPTESDLEDDDEEDSDDDDPANWFEDDQDDGRKGQDIIEPDIDDYSDIIRIDESKLHYSTFYEPRDDGD